MRELLKRIPGVLPVALAVRGVKRSLVDTKRLEKYVREAPQVKIVVGAGNVHDPGWCPTEVDYLNLLRRADWERFFGKRKFDCLLAEHVWEHLTAEQARIAARNCFDFMVPGGYLRVAVPDGLHPDPAYVEAVGVGGSGPGGYDHKVLYNHRTFSKLFEDVGFQVKLLEYFDESGQFHFNEWSVDQGTIRRSKRFDERNRDGKLNYTSVILDARKPA